MNITLQGVQLISVPLYLQYFDFNEMFDNFVKYPEKSENFFRRYMRLEHYIDLYGLHNDGVIHYGVLDYIDSPELFVDRYQELFHDGMIDTKKFEEHIKRKFFYYKSKAEKPSSPFLKKFDFSSLFNTGSMPEAISNAVKMVSADEKCFVNAENAFKIYLYFLLCIQVGLLPDNEKTIAPLRDYLRRNSAFMITESKNIHSDSDLKLPFYSGQQNDDSNIDIVSIKNSGNSCIKVTLENTTLFRTVNPGAYLFAIRKNGKYIDFMPRITLYGEYVLRVQNEKLCTQYNHQSNYIRDYCPSSWGYSNGEIYAVDSDGNAEKEKYRYMNNTVKVSVFGTLCAFLSSNGRVKGNINVKEKNIINVFVGLNGMVGIDTLRRPVLSNPFKYTLGQKIVSAGIYEEHCIFLTDKGAVLTTDRLKIEGNIHAVAVNRFGYFVAGSDRIEWYDFSGNLQKSWNVCADELVVSDNALSGFKADNGDFFFEKILIS